MAFGAVHALMPGYGKAVLVRWAPFRYVARTAGQAHPRVDPCGRCCGLGANWRRDSQPGFLLSAGSARFRDRECHDDHANRIAYVGGMDEPMNFSPANETAELSGSLQKVRTPPRDKQRLMTRPIRKAPAGRHLTADPEVIA
jgi:hypothetical protein